MLQRHEWDKLGGLLFVARRLVEGMWAGRHAATRQGSGLEFHEYRSYVPGDVPGDIDWKLYGRTDRLFVRRYRQTTDLHAYVMVDCSASMDFAGLARRRGAVSKLDYATQLAAAIAFLTIRQADRAGLGLFSDRLHSHLPAVGTWSHLHRLCHELERAQAVKGEGDVHQSLLGAHALMRRRGVLVLISDLLDDAQPILDGLLRFRHDRFEVVVFQVLTPDELNLSAARGGMLRLVDAETGRRMRTDPRQIASSYNARIGEHLATLRRACLARGIDHNLLVTDQPCHAALRRYLSHRQATGAR